MEMKKLRLEDYSKEEKDSIKVMINVLNAHGISKTDYSVNGYADDKVCLEKKASSWLVYNGDRGRKFNLKRYDSVYPACSRMICKLADSEEAEIAMQGEFGHKMIHPVWDTCPSSHVSISYSAARQLGLEPDILLGTRGVVKKTRRSAIRGKIDSGTSTVKRPKVKIAKK